MFKVVFTAGDPGWSTPLPAAHSERIDVTLFERVSLDELRDETTEVGEFGTLRAAYGAAHRWPLDAHGSDLDRYDEDLRSTYILARDRSGSLLAGQRATALRTTVAETLSMSMWQHAVERESVAAQLARQYFRVREIDELAERGLVWDLTRMLTTQSVDPRATERKDLLLAQAALVDTFRVVGARAGSGSLLITVVTPEAKRFLDRLMPDNEVLLRGSIGPEEPESFLLTMRVDDSHQAQLADARDRIERLLDRVDPAGAARPPAPAAT
ncbi:hypothetical protein VSH64_10810 [Amycolatopsis rhabdoformis]|uniref:ESX secretion-associated protein EspG n=1 Tax=Amycolatopsis rhabdoformis TaxID=1448059 RepID=A0ABZ1IDQ1_9PSEU|nr:hypothetical protein [Amycolatopsis rhabdoformis]WSE32596.1 hypothetical protein VSH64_10810 [Amycolatopsis rhabdoformis]